jgi:ribosomal protein L11 methyltransferase
MSFGTGYHESTRTMLRLLERSVHGGERVLDVGTGTGILAIAAVLLGASQATGIDTDEWSERNARENIERNGVSDRITIERLDGNRVSGRFDLVLSNLTRLDNLALSDRLVSLVGRGGVVVAGGFYGREEPEIVERFTRLGCTADGFEREAEWSSVRFRID